MFSSNPFPHLDVFPFLPTPNSFSIPHEKEDLHFPFISNNEYMLHSTTNMENNNNNATTIIKQQDLVLQQKFLDQGSQDHDVLDYSSPEKNKIGSSKKHHGHSKICTARGTRDRRVRFSIEVAQKFFSLQDLLGFDKASKTLDWLITNSMPAIKELVEVSSVTHQCKQKFLDVINGGGSDETNYAKKKSGTLTKSSCVDGKKKKSKRRYCKDGFRVNNVARAEARARARERTKEKMRLKKQLDDDLKILVNPEVNDGNCEYGRHRLSPSDSGALKSSDCWSEIEHQSNQIRWKCIMSPETSKQSKDSSFTTI